VVTLDVQSNPLYDVTVFLYASVGTAGVLLNVSGNASHLQVKSRVTTLQNALY